MMDFKKIGEAATKADYAHHCATNGKPLCTEEAVTARHEAIGRAAVAAMIPATRDIPHLHLFEICANQCPFYGNDEEEGYSCSIFLCEIRKEPEPHMRPGPSCPAHKEASHD
ncbi:MAG: hypothetical protein MUC88_20780 [Planctomycetes bacterium]|jgi:hypothetical protein|nr:hypothetical protein [Planctomycetota bacterium]